MEIVIVHLRLKAARKENRILIAAFVITNVFPYCHCRIVAANFSGTTATLSK